MQQDIINFLPKYPNIQKLDDDLLNPYKEDFYEAIYKKKEFYDNRLEAKENIPDKTGMLMKHQKLQARFFSSHTMYDELLLLHEMGTGKTCSAVGAIEQNRAEGGGFKGALYLAKGDALINNFINELIFKCTDGRYIPENYEDLTELEKVHRKKKAIKDYYKLNTFETFAKKIKNTSDTNLRQIYNNTIIVIDEVHNLRIQSKEKGLNIYNQFYRFLHVVQDCKILLMSGTPMKDGVKEIASVMNLILPKKGGNPYFPTGDKFLAKFFDSKGVNQHTVKPDKVERLKEAFKGRVSYLKAMQSDVKKVFEGKPEGLLKYFNVEEDYMSEFQTEKYKTAYNLDRTERKGVYSKSRQAALFVFPDGSYGEKGFSTYIKKTSSLHNIGGKKAYSYTATKELKKAIRILGESEEEGLEKLAKLSSKYTASIRNILLARKKGKSVFLYNEFVQGSGLILFGAILELFGFSKASGREGDKNESPRYASLTNLTATTKQVSLLVDRFNRPDNMHGKIINVIMGSRKIAEGFSLQNVQVEEIQTPWFNYSETAQAIARGYRLGSHRGLISRGLVPRVDIYQRVSIPKPPLIFPSMIFPSIDLSMYEISEIKDISIKGVERLIRISAWDCSLAYLRNHVNGYDGQRECDYMDCDYVCDGVSHELMDEDLTKKLDYSTFQLYYETPNVRKIIKDIVLLFRDHFRMDLLSLIDFFPTYTDFELITALHTIINESTQIINKYGFPSYMKEENNIFFLVDSLSVIGRFSSEYYTEFPHVKKLTTFAKVVHPLYLASLPNIVNKLCTVTTLKDLRKTLFRLPVEVHEFLIEASLRAQMLKISKGEEVRTFILDHFNNYYTNFEGTWVVWLLDNIRVLKNGKWGDGEKNYTKLVEQFKNKKQKRLEDNPYGYYGQLNPTTQKFCIRDVTKEILGGLHKQKSGKVCANWTRYQLTDMVLNTLKMTIPTKLNLPSDNIRVDKINDMSRKNLCKNIMENNYLNGTKGNPLFSSKNAKNMSDYEIRCVLFWGGTKIKEMCHYIQLWFKKKGLLTPDKGCGETGKKKKKKLLTPNKGYGKTGKKKK